ncbi:MFS transporter [Litorihabitans aurantiacus]|uniref:Major facilitator superfamily (MFS) profile domain-containing protein n=1 Tax=Litorihabitans aurantiacus TaxID=1930061 RepID=A0AA37XHK8_9MICO|nr:MFS transporter [Litorihabitans aurantiacus]GMA33034.1 hypothetical protein GCM10025875_30260 [Litorihabitans aurantiacus]
MPLVALAYLASHLLSLLGNGIAAVALPLIVLQVTGSPLSMGAISAATAVPAVLIGLAAGVVLDRWNRRTLSATSDVISAVAIAALPVVDALVGLELWWFVVLGILGAFGDVPGMTAREVLVAAVARRSGVPLERLVGLRQALTSAALVIGPALAGTLIALLGTTGVLVVTAATSTAAALVTLLLPRDIGRVGSDGAPAPDGVAPDAVPAETPWQQITGGVAVLRRSRLLVATIVLILGLATVLAGMQGLVLPVHFTVLARPELLGLVLTALALGMLVGAALYSGLARRLSQGAWLGAGALLVTAGFVAVSTLASLPVVFAGAAVVGLGNAMLGAVLGVLQVRHTPDAARGRVLALQNSALLVAAPLGIAGAGVLAGVASASVAAFALTGVWVLALAVVLASRSLQNRPHGAPA